MKFAPKVFATLTAGALVAGAIVASAAAQPFAPRGYGPPPPYCGRFGCPDGWRGMPLWGHGPRAHYYRMWHGRRQFWIDGEWRVQGWDAAPPPVREWRDAGPWRMTRHGNETDFEMPGDVLFALDSASLSGRAQDVIAQIAVEARNHSHARLEVGGYTDTSGDAGHNRQLSEARARAVAGALAQNGIPRSHIATRGYGETHLAVQTGDDVRKAANRRVVIRLIG